MAVIAARSASVASACLYSFVVEPGDEQEGGRERRTGCGDWRGIECGFGGGGEGGVWLSFWVGVGWEGEWGFGARMNNLRAWFGSRV